MNVRRFRFERAGCSRRVARRRTITAMEADQRLRDEAEAIARDGALGVGGSATVAYQRMAVTAQMVQRQATLARGNWPAQGRYQLGLSTIVELTDAELNVTTAEVENVNARYDYQSQYAALQYTIGALR